MLFLFKRSTDKINPSQNLKATGKLMNWKLSNWTCERGADCRSGDVAFPHAHSLQWNMCIICPPVMMTQQWGEPSPIRAAHSVSQLRSWIPSCPHLWNEHDITDSVLPSNLLWRTEAMLCRRHDPLKNIAYYISALYSQNDCLIIILYAHNQCWNQKGMKLDIKCVFSCKCINPLTDHSHPWAA